MRNLLLVGFTVQMLLFFGCASPRALQPSTATPVATKEVRDELEKKMKDRMREEAEAFDKLNARMDEYQNLLVACESISDKEENLQIKSHCKERIRELKQELLDLSTLLRGTE